MYIPRVIRPRVMLSYVGWNLLIFVVWDTAVTLAYELGLELIALPFTPIGTLGMAVAIVVGFHNQWAYDRWRAGLDAWRTMQSDSRSFTAIVLGMLPATAASVDPRHTIVRRRLAGLCAAQNMLRRAPIRAGLDAHLPTAENLALPDDEHVLLHLAITQAQAIMELGSGRCDSEVVVEAVRHVTRFQELAEDCRSMQHLPLPRQFSFVTRILVWTFVMLMPMGFLAELGWGTIPLAILLSVIFTSLEQVGRFTENPFDDGMNGVPIESMARDTERELRVMLGDPDLPPKLTAVRGVLR